MRLANFVLLKDYAVAAAITFTQYVVLTINIRAISHEHYLFASATAFSAALLSAVMVRRVIHHDTYRTVLGAAMGGGLADMFGIYLTRSWS